VCTVFQFFYHDGDDFHTCLHLDLVLFFAFAVSFDISVWFETRSNHISLKETLLVSATVN